MPGAERVRSGFNDWARAEPSARSVRRAKIAVHLKAALVLGRGIHGVRRVHAVLARSDDPELSRVSLDLVRNLMVENELHACQPRAYKVTTMQDEAAKPALPSSTYARNSRSFLAAYRKFHRRSLLHGPGE